LSQGTYDQYDHRIGFLHDVCHSDVKGSVMSLVDRRSKTSSQGLLTVRERELVVAATREIFPGSVYVEEKEDPEIAAETYLVVHARSSDSLQEVSKKRRQWYEKTWSIAGDKCEQLRLAVDFEP
jgi:hypothetical protein